MYKNCVGGFVNFSLHKDKKIAIFKYFEHLSWCV